MLDAKLQTYLNLLQSAKQDVLPRPQGWQFAPCGYKTGHRPPKELDWKPFQPGQSIAGRDAHFWFCATLHTPPVPVGHRLELRIHTGREGQWDATNPQCLIYLNGQLRQGLDVNHTSVILEPEECVKVEIYLYTGMIGGKIEFLPDFVQVNEEIEALWYDLSVAQDAMRNLPVGSEARGKIELSLAAACDRLWLYEIGTERFFESLRAVAEDLRQTLYGTDLSDIQVNCIGHTHIDVAWQWSLAQTREKVQRSFSTVLALMDRYEEYRFFSSQPQLYAFLKEDAPELYEAVRQRVKEGRWEAEGAMWLEADTNLPSGESLVRQILYGKRFLKEEFGVESKILWLPDVFGYSAALPQILNKCGVDIFVTSKIGWNDTNKMPYDTFLWRGLDGTEVFTSFITARNLPRTGESDKESTYNGDITANQVLGTWARYQQKEYCSQAYIPFGFGDGGGGPTREMLERQRRLSRGLPGIPRTCIRSAGEFLPEMKAEFLASCQKWGRTPRWVGELYLEFHRGTYTTMARNKRYNRKCELLYGRAEALAAFGAVLFGRPYPQSEFASGWRILLLNQFHDIIPGSSNREVYEESQVQYKYAAGIAQTIEKNCLNELAGSVKTGGGIFVYNPNGFSISGSVEVEGQRQYVCDVPAFGWKVVEQKRQVSTGVASQDALENAFFRLHFGPDGSILSFLDKRYGRELVRPGERLNDLLVFADYPSSYDAWEISKYTLDHKERMGGVTGMEPVYEPDRVGLCISRKFQHSTLKQTVYLYDSIPRVDFETEADWQDKHILLKAAFPFDLHTDKATYDVQFGNLERPTHANTSWDAAKYEVCAHKWADLSEGGYGVSLLNDCKYGHGASGSTLTLTLLRCPSDPNPDADLGAHRFVYSLYPHGGDFRTGGTIQQALALNQPLLACRVPGQEGVLSETGSMLWCDQENIVIETIKKAEDTPEMIVRFYEAHNCRGDVTLHFGFEVRRVCVCNLLEEAQEILELQNQSVTLPVRGYEIVTLKLTGPEIFGQ